MAAKVKRVLSWSTYAPYSNYPQKNDFRVRAREAEGPGRRPKNRTLRRSWWMLSVVVDPVNERLGIGISITVNKKGKSQIAGGRPNPEEAFQRCDLVWSARRSASRLEIESGIQWTGRILVAPSRTR